ncbi:MAG: RES family NAD+ phosphorylase [Terracidiphilus sp.]|jgi:RES domain-containing protein
MMTLWRISKYADLSGEGGRIGSARWHTMGRPVVYLTESPAGAMLERIVHMIDLDRNRDGNLPLTFQLLQVAIPEELAIKALSTIAPADWKERPEYTQQVGDGWLASTETALARVPSAIAPRTWNYLLNPAHPDAKQVQVAEVIKERFDNQLFRFGAR